MAFFPITANESLDDTQVQSRQLRWGFADSSALVRCKIDAATPPPILAYFTKWSQIVWLR